MPFPTDKSGPKLANVDPCTKLVYCPVIITERISPALPELGITDRICDGGFTVKAALLRLRNLAPPEVDPETVTL